MRVSIPGRRTAHLQRLFLLSLLSIGIVTTMQAQSNHINMKRSSLESTLPIVVPPSPNNATLTRNISESVDLYTGKLSVEVPLYTLKSRQIELPISLQTVANAHKVNDVGGWTGLGWYLNAGGVISRVMKNLPDEYNGTIHSNKFNFHGVGYLNLYTAQENFISFDRFAPAISPATQYSINDMKNIIHRGNWNTRNDRPDKGYDLQPDEFYFNFGKYSGKFVFEQNGRVLLTSADNVKFSTNIVANKITGFTALTEDGYTYEFGNYALNAVEETSLKVESKSMLFSYAYFGCEQPNTFTTDNGHQQTVDASWYYDRLLVMSYKSPEPYTNVSVPAEGLMEFEHPNNFWDPQYPTYSSSWYLTKIKAPTGDEVNFNYIANGQLTYVSDRSFTQSSPKPLAGAGSVCNTNGGFFLSRVPPKQVSLAPGFWHYPSYGDYSVSKSIVTVSSKKLKEIVTSQGIKVEFIANTSRPELPGDERLDKISVQYNGAVVKEYLFDYETFHNDTEPVDSRVFDFWGPVYLFPPNGGACYGTAFTLTTRTLTGEVEASARYRTYLRSITEKGSGGETVPPYQFDYYYPDGLPFRTSKSQDKYGFARDHTAPPVLSKLLAGALLSVKYPTGATKKFNYQVNGNSTTWSGLRIASTEEYESSAADPIVKNYSYGPYRATDYAITSYEMPDYGYFYNQGGTDYYTTAGEKIFSSEVTRVNPETLTRGAAGGYDWVEVSQFNNGSHRMEFYTVADNPDAGTPVTLVSGFLGGFTRTLNMSFPFPQTTSNDWKRGLPKAEYVKAADGTAIQSTHYDYDFSANAASIGRAWGLQVSKYRIDFGGDWNWMIFGRYGFYPNWQLNTSKTTREYAADGQHYRETVVQNSYDKIQFNNKEWLFLKERKILADSKNEQVVERVRYPLHYNPTSDAFGAGIAQLKVKNVLNAPVERYEFRQNADGSNKRYISGTLNKYYSDKPLLEQIFSLQSNSPIVAFTESHTQLGTFVRDPLYNPTTNFSRYTSYGKIEEQSLQSNAKESYIWDATKTNPLAKATNASFSDIAYTSFEDGDYGNWTVGGMLSTDKAFSGTKSYYVGPGLSKSGLDPNKTYVVTYWVQKPFVTVQVNGTVASSLTGPEINGWVYYEKKVTGVSTLTLSGTATVDDVRLFPANAQMNTYQYDPKVGLTAEIDQNGRIKKYEYDGLQRLKLIKDGEGNILKSVDYNYKNAATAPMWSNTAERRCQPCPANGNYHTNIEQVKQVDVNPNSGTYKSERWYDQGYSSSCNVQQDWQNISGPVCLTNANGFNTGMKRYVQQNMNPCSADPGATRNVDVADPATCPSNEPVWQATEEYRCRPCSNPAYISKFQERKWIDVNPVSNSPFEWRETGAFCTVPADYQATGATRCMADGIGLPNGRLEREQKDMNPCSPTYGNIRWIWEESPACPRIYAYITRGDYKSNPDGSVTEDIYINFYYNEAGTQPATMTNFTFTIEEDWQSQGNSQFFYHTFTINGSSKKLFEDRPTEFPIDGGNDWVYAQFNLKYP